MDVQNRREDEGGEVYIIGRGGETERGGGGVVATAVMADTCIKLAEGHYFRDHPFHQTSRILWWW
jgi:hypothetical protein